MTDDKTIENRSLNYGKKCINYHLFFSNRKTLEIAVLPDCSVVIKSPFNADISLIEQKIHKRARWILKQIRFFQQFQPRTPERRYVNGETHLYLGKQYRLKISRAQTNMIKLARGFFIINCKKEPNPELIKQLMDEWYLGKALHHFNESLNRCWKNFQEFDIPKPSISMKRMKKRWGSLSEKGKMTLNSELIKAPRECIDYVVTHELCHIKHKNHSAEFYNLLYSIIPDWKTIKQKLELKMI